MRKFEHILMTCLLALLLSACGKNAGIVSAEINDMPKSDNAAEKNTVQLAVSVKIRYSEQEGVILTEEDTALIKNALNEEWEKEVAECSNDIIFIIDGAEVLYHTACGTFNDIVNNKHIVVDEALQKRINELIKAYLEIDSFEELS